MNGIFNYLVRKTVEVLVVWVKFQGPFNVPKGFLAGALVEKEFCHVTVCKGVLGFIAIKPFRKGVRLRSASCTCRVGRDDVIVDGELGCCDLVELGSVLVFLIIIFSF